MHSSPTAGHSGYYQTLHRAKGDFYWLGMKADIKAFVCECDTCQRNKLENLKPTGFLQLLPIPERAWADISMDFIEGLPNSHGYTVVLVVVDKLTKYAHFLAISHPYTAVTIAHQFTTHALKLHGLPQTIVSNWDSIFLIYFWSKLFKLQKTTLAHSSAYHPQSEEQTKVVNKCLGQYLRYYCGEQPKSLSTWLSMVVQYLSSLLYPNHTL